MILKSAQKSSKFAKSVQRSIDIILKGAQKNVKLS